MQTWNSLQGRQVHYTDVLQWSQMWVVFTSLVYFSPHNTEERFAVIITTMKPSPMQSQSDFFKLHCLIAFPFPETPYFEVLYTKKNKKKIKRLQEC